MDKATLSRLELLNQIKLDDAQRENTLCFFAQREAEIADLDAIDTSATSPMVHVIPKPLDMREDTPEQLFLREDLQEQAPVIDAGYFCVPRVIE